jgi:hypothetical protein
VSGEIELKRKSICAPVRNSSLCRRRSVSIFPIQCYTKKDATLEINDTEANVQTQRNIPIPILIILFEHIRHALQTNACLDEKIEADGILAAPVVRAVEEGDELRGEAVAKCDEGFAELLVRDATGAVDVEAVEEVAPGGEETP